MCRSFERTIYPAGQKGKTVETYTYPPKTGSEIHGLVFVDLESVGSLSYAKLSPDEARTMAQALLAAADQAEADLSVDRAVAQTQQAEQVPA